jgi:hypothetical protein
MELTETERTDVGSIDLAQNIYNYNQLPVADFYKDDFESSGSVKCGNFMTS